MQPKFAYMAFAIIRAVSQLIIGSYFWLQTYHPEVGIWTGVPFTMIILTFICHTVLLPIHLILMGEMFPSELRNFSVAIVECVGYSATFVMLKLYTLMKHSMGLHGIFFFNASFAGFCAIYSSFTIPDNRGKSLSEIEKKW